MRQGTYLNVILTVNAALLTGLLWVQLAGHSTLSTEASAQTQTQPPISGNPSLIPINAADQRQRQIEGLREVKSAVDSMSKLLESGKVKVEVTNVDQLKSLSDKK